MTWRNPWIAWLTVEKCYEWMCALHYSLCDWLMSHVRVLRKAWAGFHLNLLLPWSCDRQVGFDLTSTSGVCYVKMSYLLNFNLKKKTKEIPNVQELRFSSYMNFFYVKIHVPMIAKRKIVNATISLKKKRKKKFALQLLSLWYKNNLGK